MTQRSLLLIDTGGTIGMVPGAQGLTPGQGVIAAFLAPHLPSDVALKTISFDPLLDSANVTPADWNRLLDLLDAHAGWPVLITHGTDTLSYTAAALSQVIAPERAPVCLCAAMEPVGQGADAEPTLLHALELALSAATGVQAVLEGQSFAAAGLSKQISNARDAFVSIPQPGFAVAPHGSRFPEDRDLGVVTMVPGLSARALQAQLLAFEGVVLRIYGSGTFPDRADLGEVVAQAMLKGVQIRVVSQCLRGGLHPGTYAAGDAFWQLPLTNGGVETPELAFARLALSLGA
ncbi:hypothetical protein BFP70_16110 [Thioclava sp. SK-1]|uniref:asparaginase domain-containing protein n=1 Tax=Thioclava sp. SK-1 TaxID=1889770 RepID=UPI0008271A4E|nr:asparaginase domain-containing protein [Thioclava sp. SK-1]OCX61191.1 hypothetical protein BFP70_16110 [Thioclava sp. SK-1]